MMSPTNHDSYRLHALTVLNYNEGADLENSHIMGTAILARDR
jgi:hypothetical protein